MIFYITMYKGDFAVYFDNVHPANRIAILNTKELAIERVRLIAKQHNCDNPTIRGFHD